MNLHRIIEIGGMAVCGLLLCGCSTIVNGSNQSVFITTQEVTGAHCNIAAADNPTWRQVFYTPDDIKIPRGNRVLRLECAKDGYKTASRLVRPKAEPTSAGNALNGVIIGVGVDAAAGSLYKYPDTVILPMIAE